MKVKTKSATLAKLISDLKKDFEKGGLTKADVTTRYVRANERVETDKDLPRNAVIAPEPSMKFYDDREAQNPLKIAGPNAHKAAYVAAVQYPTGSKELYTLGSDADQRAHAEFQDLHDGMVLCKMLVPGWTPGTSAYWPQYSHLRDQLVGKIMSSSGVATGAEFIPNLLSGELTREFRMAMSLAGLLRHINMPKSPFTLPLGGASIKTYLASEASDDKVGSDSADAIKVRNAATADVTFTAIALKVAAYITAEADEDSIIPMVPFIREELANANAESIEDALINGDDTSPYQDTKDTEGTTIDSTHHDRAWQGLRAMAITSGNTFDLKNAAMTATAVMNVLKNFGKYYKDPKGCLIVTGMIAQAQMITDNKVKTVSELGPNATIITGQLGEVYGVPIVQSGQFPENLNASGVNDDTTTDRTGLIVLHRESHAIGDRRAVTIKSREDIRTDKHEVVTTWRGDFQRVLQEKTTPVARNVGYVFNVSTASTLS